MPNDLYDRGGGSEQTKLPSSARLRKALYGAFFWLSLPAYNKLNIYLTTKKFHNVYYIYNTNI